MSKIILHDTGRNMAASWPADAVNDGLAAGLIVCAHEAPPEGRSHRPSAMARRDCVLNERESRQFFFDACTYATPTTVGADYEKWDLWQEDSGVRFDRASLEYHYRRVFDVQQDLGAPLLTPSPRLDTTNDAVADAALAVTQQVVGDPSYQDCWLTVAGTSGFWSSGRDLDRYLGRLNDVPHAGWFLVVVRETNDYPPRVTENEVAGLCRSVYSLSRWNMPVVVAHGDLQALPTVAAGASLIGTGWDLKQRVLAADAYRQYDGDGGSWFKRVTFERMACALHEVDARQFYDAAPDLAARLAVGPLPPDVKTKAWHHLRSLNRLTDSLPDGGGEAAANAVHQFYSQARRSIDLANRRGRISADLAHMWIESLQSGLENWMDAEGWSYH